MQKLHYYTSGFPDWWLTTCYRSSTGSNFIIHVLNADGILADDENLKISHDDLVKNFSEGSTEAYSNTYAEVEEACLKVRWEGCRNIKSVFLHTPERAEDHELEWSLENGRLTIKLGYYSFKGYAIIDIQA